MVYRITSPDNCISRLPGLTNRRLSNDRKPSRWHRQPFWISGPKYLVFPPPDTPIPLDIYLAGCFSPKLLNSSPQKGLSWLRLKQDLTPSRLPRVHNHIAALLNCICHSEMILIIHFFMFFPSQLNRGSMRVSVPVCLTLRLGPRTVPKKYYPMSKCLTWIIWVGVYSAWSLKIIFQLLHFNGLKPS